MKHLRLKTPSAINKLHVLTCTHSIHHGSCCGSSGGISGSCVAQFLAPVFGLYQLNSKETCLLRQNSPKKTNQAPTWAKKSYLLDGWCLPHHFSHDFQVPGGFNEPPNKSPRSAVARRSQVDVGDEWCELLKGARRDIRRDVSKASQISSTLNIWAALATPPSNSQWEHKKINSLAVIQQQLPEPSLATHLFIWQGFWWVCSF